jgi:uncharacterized protein (TIGR00369 family)
MAKHRALLMTPAEITRHLEEPFPDTYSHGWTFRIEEMVPMAARVRLPYEARHLRPGGTISGPAMFHLADYSMWVLIMGMTGKDGIASVTSSINMHFLRKPGPVDLIAHARLIKLGRRLAVGDIALYSEGEPEMVALASPTYALPG